MITFSEMLRSEADAVISLWKTCNLTRPWNDPLKDLEFALAGENSSVIVGKIDGRVVASAMVGHDGHRGALYYVAVDPALQKKGHGSALIKACEDWLIGQGVWKINILIRKDNSGATNFYETAGFELNDVVSMGKRIG